MDFRRMNVIRLLLVLSLFPVSADSLGAGRAISDLPLAIDSLTGKPHVIVYGRGGRPETCAAIGPPRSVVEKEMPCFPPF